MATVLVIGSGGRESSIVRGLSASEKVAQIYVHPGNPGIFLIEKTIPLSVDSTDINEIVLKCEECKVDVVVVGPEKYLEDGIVDQLKKYGIKAFGPEKESAKIETSKAWAKTFMKKYSVPTADCDIFEDVNSALQFVEERCPWNGIVVKASGLCGGKGVFVCHNKEQAKDELEKLQKCTGQLRKASQTVVLEERLEGFEVSVQTIVDTKGNYIILPISQDHKKRFEGNSGPNTGGMGAICPVTFLSEKEKFQIEDIIKRAVAGLKSDKLSYAGVLYAGLMIGDTVNVLEFNCRFGDPETQVVLPLVKNDIFSLIKAAVDDALSEVVLQVEDRFCSNVVIVAKDYPSSGKFPPRIIQGISEISRMKNITVNYSNIKIEDERFYSLNGRVMSVCSKEKSLLEAVLSSSKAACLVKFFDSDFQQNFADYRKDIGFFAITLDEMKKNKDLTYASSGVSVQNGNIFVDQIKNIAKSSIGGFGGLYSLKNMRNPVLVAGADGVGTKLKIAEAMKNHRTIGKDLVAMCVNDILVCGAQPIFFLDYYACGSLDVEKGLEVIAGIKDGCDLAQCPLLGGETAEMPGIYAKDAYDLAGFAVGVMEPEHQLPRRDIMEEGDYLVGVKSSGLHSNGFSFIRKLVKKFDWDLHSEAPFHEQKCLGEVFLTPTRIYRNMLSLLRSDIVLGAAHITGGGLPDNLPRILPEHLSAKISHPWHPSNIYLWMIAQGVPIDEMMKVFNMGIGIVLVVKSSYNGKRIFPEELKQKLNRYSEEDFFIIGNLVKAEKERVTFDIGICTSIINKAGIIYSKCPVPRSLIVKKNVAVIISGTGSNLQALIEHTMNNSSYAQISLVISNVSSAYGLQRAVNAAIPTMIIEHKKFSSRELFEKEIHEELTKSDIEFVCLAGFMRILTKWFVNQWFGKMLNTHPSLLPSFKGKDAQKQALEAGVKVTGCTVHFVNEDVDCGKIVAQESVNILPNDTVESLSERIKKAEHVAYPRALEKLVRGEISAKK